MLDIIEQGRLKREEALEVMEKWSNELAYDVYVVGIDGSNTPDPKYWQDRWLTLKAPSKDEAIKLYKEYHYLWLRPEEKNQVKILGIGSSDCNTWMLENQVKQQYA